MGRTYEEKGKQKVPGKEGCGTYVEKDKQKVPRTKCSGTYAEKVRENVLFLIKTGI